MNDVAKKCPACFEVHADYTSLPDDDKIMCGICGVKFSPSWFVENSINKVSNSSKSLRSQRKREPSDIELLRKIAKHSEESAFVLKRFLFVAQIFAALWILDKVLLLFFS